MTDAELLHYARHILLDEIGITGQAKLTAARVLIIGTGGLGCPAALALAHAGVGILTLADGDVVDATNLQRQTLHSHATVGIPKVDSARAALLAANPHISVHTIQAKLVGEALLNAVAAHDIVLDCTDNFTSRHAINAACFAACFATGKPLISGAAIRFDGQVAVFDPRQSSSPCYQCLFPAKSTEAGEDACATLGVFAPLTAIVGNMQATQAIQMIAGFGTPLVGKLWLYDAKDSSVRVMKVPRDTACVVCKTRPA